DLADEDRRDPQISERSPQGEVSDEQKARDPRPDDHDQSITPDATGRRDRSGPGAGTSSRSSRPAILRPALFTQLAPAVSTAAGAAPPAHSGDPPRQIRRPPPRLPRLAQGRLRTFDSLLRLCAEGRSRITCP